VFRKGSQFSQSLSQQRDPPLRAIAGELVELSEELEVEAIVDRRKLQDMAWSVRVRNVLAVCWVR
jgi:hypothetical protein